MFCFHASSFSCPQKINHIRLEKRGLPSLSGTTDLGFGPGVGEPGMLPR
jgi:hypothetical protein